MTVPLDLAAIRAAEARIRPYILRTPILPVAHRDLWLKAESLQRTGAFKLRGALNALITLDPAAKARGVIAHSSGNHAQAVAYAAFRLGISASVVMPDDAPAVKLDATRSWGAEVILTGPAFTERAAVAERLAAERGLALIEPYNAPEIVAGAASVGIEIAEDQPGIDRVYVQASGGGLCAGVALALSHLSPDTEIVAVEPALCGHVRASFTAGRAIAIPPEQSGRTMADGMRANRLGDVNWAVMADHVDRVVQVDEAAIGAAMLWLAGECRLIAEPAGATAVAAALAESSRAGTALAIVSGGNVDLALLASLRRERDGQAGLAPLWRSTQEMT